MNNTEYMFHSTTDKITKQEANRRDKIARKYGGSFVGPLTIAGNVGRSWFAIENKGEPFNSRTAKEILTACGLVKFVLRRKADGWFACPGANHTSNPSNAIILDETETADWLSVWGKGYEAVPLNEAKEVV